MFERKNDGRQRQRASILRAAISVPRKSALLAVCLSSMALAGCQSTTEGLLTPVAADIQPQQTRTILAVTNRKPDTGTSRGLIFGGERDTMVHFLSLTMSMPPGRIPGTLPVNHAKPDPKKDITLVRAHDLDYRDLKAQVAALPKTTGKAKPRALVFTHGYNTQFDESVVRFAQIVDDTKFEGLPILFSWPSRGATAGYGYDKDSVNYSRDSMQQLLSALAAEPNLGGIDIFAHSMGAWLTMETLRQIALSKDAKTLDRIGTVVLAAPDIDFDVFRTQISQLGALRGRLTVYVSSNDRALQISRRLFGGKIRTGETTDPAQFQALGIEAHDISAVKGGLGKDHGKAFGDATTIAGIGHALAAGPQRTIPSGLETLILAVPRLDNGLLTASARQLAP
ncbi:alpha/beta fold hydrolase [Rhizobium sp. FY34]|uniref:alpha/beta hydrolase n=1 Tax=Rhizobium sp. FY34 TaxID=2562309 RepID=UPI001484CAAD|nr:alpha/beta fold hydrolase [Rhizobium sp. FY34]